MFVRLCHIPAFICFAVAIFLDPSAKGAATFEILKSFSIPGRQPSTQMVRDEEGNLYGTASGGAEGNGIVFKVSPSGEVTTIRHIADAQTSIGYLHHGRDGWLYGISGGGGSAGKGMISRLSKDGEFEHLYDFTPDMAVVPRGPLLEVATGDFYGVTSGGGAFGAGVIFRFRVGSGLTVVHHRAVDNTGVPSSPLGLGNDGKLYGATQRLLFRVSTTGEYEPLFTFPVSNEPPTYPMGNEIDGPLTLGTDGKFYGVTTNGGNNGHGTFFSLAEDGTVELLHHYAAQHLLNGGLVEGEDGWLYGTSFHPGGLYRISKLGAFEMLKEFSMEEPAVDDGFTPFAGVTRVGNVIYGTTGLGGPDNGGTVFKYSVADGFQTLHRFGTGDGYGFSTRLYPGPNFALYATTDDGGALGHGSIVRIGLNGGVNDTVDFWHGFNREVPLSFTSQESLRLGVASAAGIDGELYALTRLSGSVGGYRISKITPDGTETVIRNFTDFELPRPAFSASPFIRGPQSDGQIYLIVHVEGGFALARLEPNGNLIVSEHVLPAGVVTLARGFDDAFIGGTPSTIYRINPDGASSILRSFGDDEPFAATTELGLNIYRVFHGFTLYPGTLKIKRFFGISSLGSFLPIKEYTMEESWEVPANLVEGSDGNFYGVSDGHVLRITPKGKISSIYSLPTLTRTLLSKGGGGAIYGLTRFGGPGGGGQAFRIKLTRSAPIAQDDQALVRPGEEVVIPILVNDSDADDQELNINAYEGTHGRVQIEQGGIRYIPGPSFTAEDSFAYTIDDGHGGTATAAVQVRNPFYGESGNFETVLTDPSGRYAGRLKLTINRLGKASGWVVFNGVRTTIKGKMSLAGALTMTVTSGKQPPIVIDLNLGFAASPANLTGVVHVGGENSTVYNSIPAAARAFSLPEGIPSGRWTMHLSSPQGDDLPQGFGWARVNIKRSGELTLTGKLCDGTIFSCGTNVLRNGTVLLQQSFKRRRGEIFGSIDLQPAEDAESNGSLSWRKGPSSDAYYPHGFESQVIAYLSPYVKPVGGQRVLSYGGPVLDVNFEAGGLGSIAAAMNLSPTDVATPLLPNDLNLKLTIDRTNGRFAGSLLPSGATKPTKFNGVFDQAAHSGFGFFLNNAESGAVRLIPR
jgi:uncharacterized repeat protein (TIGR03803 family)